MTTASSPSWSSKALCAVLQDVFHEPEFKTDDTLRPAVKGGPNAAVSNHLAAAEFKRARVERVAVRLKQLLAAEAQGASAAVAA